MDAFELCKTELANQVTFVHRDLSQRLCVYIDTSDLAWAGIITQVSMSDAHRRRNEQRHTPTSHHSGRLRKTQLGWSIVEEVAYAVVNTLDRTHWLVATPAGFDLYTDHKNLIFLSSLLAVADDMSQPSMQIFFAGL